MKHSREPNRRAGEPATVLRELRVGSTCMCPRPIPGTNTGGARPQLPVAGMRVALQEYGKPGVELVEGLQQRGATVTRVSVYRWDLPEDLGPLRAAIGEIAEKQVGIALFTSAQQIEHLLILLPPWVARRISARLSRPVRFGSIGPTTSETLRAHKLPVDIEPEHPELGHLIAAVAGRLAGAGKVVLK